MRHAVLALLLIPLSQANAITNIEEKRRSQDSNGWQNSITAAFDAESGNSKKRLWNIGLNTSWQNDDHRVFGWYTRTYESINDERASDDTFAHLRYVRHHKAFFGQEAFTQYERDPFASLQYRYLVGGGVRLQKRFDDESLIRQGIGLFHEQVKEDSSNGTYTNQLTRLNLYTHGETSLGMSNVLATVYLQPSVDDTDDVRALARFTLRVPVSARTDLRWQWQSRWDSMPPEGTEHHNHQTQMAVSVRF